jgi:hypothetical protein
MIPRQIYATEHTFGEVSINYLAKTDARHRLEERVCSVPDAFFVLIPMSEFAGLDVKDGPRDCFDIHGRARDTHCHQRLPSRDDDRHKPRIECRGPAISVAATAMAVYYRQYEEN